MNNPFKNLNTEDVEYFIEAREIYDGWCAAKMKDGTYYNRWPVGDKRHEQTKAYIEAYDKELKKYERNHRKNCITT